MIASGLFWAIDNEEIIVNMVSHIYFIEKRETTEYFVSKAKSLSFSVNLKYPFTEKPTKTKITISEWISNDFVGQNCFYIIVVFSC